LSNHKYIITASAGPHKVYWCDGEWSYRKDEADLFETRDDANTEAREKNVLDVKIDVHFLRVEHSK